ncbi:hypothetical protein JOD67_004567 [Tenggerimyces flavus]|nr:hypothetical protein [Tenggerimyces flavus]
MDELAAILRGRAAEYAWIAPQKDSRGSHARGRAR